MIIKENTQFNNQVSENIEKIRELFPNTVTESDKGLMIDFDKLKDELSSDLMDSKEERYQMTWPGKKASLKIANEPTDKTLIPERESSVDFDNTQNIYIEGDNLEALKILKKSYQGKIKCIYIDPPYNRKVGEDLIYKDNFSKIASDYLQLSGIKNSEGDFLSSNRDDSGRFHSNWLTMIYPRIKLGFDLLKNDGAIFISIDDSEVSNTIKILDEVFGSENFAFCAPRKTRSSATTKGENELQKLHDYVICYFKCKSESLFRKKIIGNKTYNLQDSRGSYYTVPLQDNGPAGYRKMRPNLYYPIHEKKDGTLSLDETDSIKIYLPDKKKGEDGRWMWSKEKFQKEHIDLVAINNKIYIKHYFNEIEDQNKYQIFKSWLDNFPNSEGSKELTELFGIPAIFDNPKPTSLINYLLNLIVNKDSIILDFFGGSSTTAHSVMHLNSIDKGTRKYILVQLEEKINRETYPLQYNYLVDNLKLKPLITEIGKERIRRAGKKIKEETNADIDYGFKVFKVSDSILNPNTEISPNTLNQEALNFENIKDSVSNEDLIYFSILKTGRPLDSEIIKESIGKNEFFTVLDSEENKIIVACFDKEIEFNDEIIKMIADKNPLRVYFRDSSFKSDNDKINFEQKLKELSSESIEIYVL